MSSLWWKFSKGDATVAEMPNSTLSHFKCHRCGRLASKPWAAAWCLHHDSNFQPRPPESLDADWTRMAIVSAVTCEPFSAQASDWYVVEHQNRYSHPDGREAAEDWSHRVVAGPYLREKAYDVAEEMARVHKRPDWPSHGHGFDAMPGDLVSA